MHHAYKTYHTLHTSHSYHAPDTAYINHTPHTHPIPLHIKHIYHHTNQTYNPIYLPTHRFYIPHTISQIKYQTRHIQAYISFLFLYLYGISEHVMMVPPT